MIIKNYIRPIISQKLLKKHSLKEAIKLCKYYSIENDNIRCPICGHYTLGQDWVCQHCGWQQDNLIENDDEYSYSNYCSINEFKLIYNRVGKNKPFNEYWEKILRSDDTKN